jgi:helix-turn-helix protein
MALEMRFDVDTLRPLVREVVSEVLAALDADRARLGNRLAFSEAEAAELLGLNGNQLRDLRLDGKIAACRIVGGRIAYQRDDLLRYLTDRRIEAGANGSAWRRKPR